jgi:hypothetical protein
MQNTVSFAISKLISAHHRSCPLMVTIWKVSHIIYIKKTFNHENGHFRFLKPWILALGHQIVKVLPREAVLVLFGPLSAQSQLKLWIVGGATQLES